MASIVATRPRIFVTPSSLAELKLRYTAGDPICKELKRLTEAFLGADSYSQIPNRGLMYLLTGDPRYADAAIRDMKRMALTGLSEVSKDSWYYTREICTNVAIGYDWCYPAIPAADLATITNALNLWNHAIWPDTNPARAGAWGVNNPTTNYWWGFLSGTWIGSLSVGDQSILDLSLTKWNGTGLPYLDSRGAGGVLADGTTYGMGTTMLIGWMLEAHRSATGENLAPAWCWDALQACYHLSSPGLKKQATLGDQSDAPGGNQRIVDRDAVLANYAQDDYTKTWLDGENPPNPAPYYHFQEVLWYPLSGGAPLDTLPRRFAAAGIGFVSLRTAWSPEATVLWARLGERGASHANAAAGEWQIMRGNDDLVVKVGTYSSSGIAQAAQHCNCPIVDDRGQDPEWKPPGAPIVTETERYTHVLSCQMAAAYDYRVSGVTKKPLVSYTREFLFLPGAVVITRDLFQKSNPQSQVMVPINTVNAGNPPGSAWQRFAMGVSALEGQWVTGGTLTQVPVKLGTGGATCCWRSEFRPAAGTTIDEVIHVLQTGPATFTPLPVTRTARGVQVGDDEFNWVGGDLIYTDHRKSPLDHALADLAASVHAWESSDQATGGPEEMAVIEGSRLVVSEAPPPPGETGD